jgi:hypothetical protein
VPAEPDAQRSANVFALYERAVQTPVEHVTLFGRIFEELRGRRAVSLREDFCGTFLLAKTWVTSGPARTAIALDLDRTALQDGRRRHQRRLAPGARRRLRPLRRDVRSVTAPKVDVVAAGNCSFWAITEWRDLVAYLRCVRRSLAAGGIVVLETAGGPGMINTMAERTTVKRDGDFSFRYVWRQRGFNPITHRLQCSISFELGNGRLLRDAFVYDWRLWTLPEVERALREAGFTAVKHYWEGRASARNGNGTAGAPYRATERAPNHHAWICFVVGLR